MLIPPDAEPTCFFLPVLPPLVKGSTVRIDGIASRQELNGQTATCLWHDQHKGRWNVKLSSGEGISLKDECLRVIAADGSILRCLRLLDETDPEYIANTMALRHHRLYAEAAGCFDLKESSLQEWMNQAHRMARHGSIPTEDIRENLRNIGNGYALGAHIGEALRESLDLQNLGGEALYVFQQSLYSVMSEKMKEGQEARSSGNMGEFMQKEVKKVLDNLVENGTPEEDTAEMKELFDSFIASTTASSGMNESDRQTVTMKFVERFQALQATLEHSSDEHDDRTESQWEKKIDGACYVKDVRKVRRWLRSKRIHVDYADSNGESLLHKAMISAQRNTDSGDCLDLVRLLLREGADIEGALGTSETAASFAGAVGLPSCKELLLRTQHARDMWFMWIKCRALCDQERAAAPKGMAGCLMAVNEDVFRECIKLVWGPRHYEASLWEITLPLPTDATQALRLLQEVANAEFQAKWQLEDSPESDLAQIWKDFQENCTYEEHMKIINLGMGSPAEM
eukprot:TRINITY_DN11694_c0_g3_i1.p1 TRINITY_DN11694_c0_g3~~TRINITY_DN11694_c0_g3_i1.p1  ORF type:complete len:512 (-),score=87.03 TRINITY_DN11694_c0_g3_i1:245-1780(-)